METSHASGRKKYRKPLRASHDKGHRPGWLVDL